MINAIPDLMPQINKSDIIDAIDALEKLSAEIKIDYKYFHKLINWFKEKEFYLDQLMCDKINKLREEIYSKDDASIKIVYDDLKPNLEMNNSYYIE